MLTFFFTCIIYLFIFIYIFTVYFKCTTCTMPIYLLLGRSVPNILLTFYHSNISGYMFRKGRMKITVSKVFKISQSSMSPEPISQSYLVELSVSIIHYIHLKKKRPSFIS